MRAHGKVWKFGHNVDTDAMAPGKFLGLEMKQLATHTLEIINPQFPKQVKFGDIVVGGRNFGCGSSREHAVRVMKILGVGCILAESFARIFYRNAIATGLPVLAVPAPFWEKVQEGDTVSADLEQGIVTNQTQNLIFHAPPLPGGVLKVITQGGIIPTLKQIVRQKEG